MQVGCKDLGEDEGSGIRILGSTGCAIGVRGRAHGT